MTVRTPAVIADYLPTYDITGWNPYMSMNQTVSNFMGFILSKN